MTHTHTLIHKTAKTTQTLGWAVHAPGHGWTAVVYIPNLNVAHTPDCAQTETGAEFNVQDAVANDYTDEFAWYETKDRALSALIEYATECGTI